MVARSRQSPPRTALGLSYDDTVAIFSHSSPGRSGPAPSAGFTGYLASALTGLRDEQRSEVFELSDTVAEVCAKSGIALYEPRKSTDPVHHAHVPDDQVFRLDRRRVARSDLIIYLAHYPSTGAGQELVIAQGALVPIIVLAYEGAPVSRMVTGLPGTVLLRHRDLATLADGLTWRIEQLRPSMARRRAAFAEHHHAAFGDRLRRLRQERGLTHEKLAAMMRVPGLISAGELADWEAGSDQESNLHLVQLREIASALGVPPAELLG